MPVYKVKVKWGKETFPDVELSTDEDPLVFKAQLFALTGVQPERQKVVVKGTTVRDTDWNNVKLKDGTAVLLMGSKEEDVPSEPIEKTVFVEDMSEADIATKLDLPAGLTNLGNTCYMNATVQCLKTVPELRKGLENFEARYSGGSTAPSQAITVALRDLYATMDRGVTFPPAMLLHVLHEVFPRFAEKGDSGAFMQQDANECWTEIVRMLQQRLPPNPGSASGYSSLVEQYFGGTLDVELKCKEAEDEPPTQCQEQFLQLSCFIDKEVNYMLSGLRSRMQEEITKNSPTLGRDAVYTKSSKISRLPAYLSIQFVRFQFKEKMSINAKVLRDVKFPIEFDAIELCTPELQEKLAPMRQRFKDQGDKMVEDALSGNEKSEKDNGDSKIKTKKEPYWLPNDIGSNNSGFYTLQAVLTHRGRTSTSGHYVAWVKHSETTWLMCDDDDVTPVTIDDVLKLSGGGDWHCAYVLLYGPKSLEVPIESESKELKDQAAVESMETGNP